MTPDRNGAGGALTTVHIIERIAGVMLGLVTVLIVVSAIGRYGFGTQIGPLDDRIDGDRLFPHARGDGGEGARHILGAEADVEATFVGAVRRFAVGQKFGAGHAERRYAGAAGDVQNIGKHR